jgi:hypothetical protein
MQSNLQSPPPLGWLLLVLFCQFWGGLLLVFILSMSLQGLGGWSFGASPRIVAGRRIQNIIVVFFSPSLPPNQLIVASPGQSTLPRLSIQSTLNGQGPTVGLVTLPVRAHLVPESNSTGHCPIYGRCEGCFTGPTTKLTASAAKDAREGIGNSVGWLSSGIENSWTP